MASVINYDLTSELVHRRTSPAFDKDWALFLEIASNNDLRIRTDTPVREGLAECSCREFDGVKASRDVLDADRSVRRTLARGGREVVFGRAR